MTSPYTDGRRPASVPRGLRALASSAALGAALFIPTAAAGDLEFENVHGGVQHAIHMASDGETGWIAEDGGRIRFSDDGFSTWTFQTTPDTARVQLRGIYFMDDDTTGWAVGDKHTVLYTTNGGTTWTQVASSNLPDWPEEPEDQNLWDVHFIEVEDESEEAQLYGWITGREGVLWLSRDGGLTWESEHNAYTSSPWLGHLFKTEDRYGVWFTDDGAGTYHGYVSGDWAAVMHCEFSATYDSNDPFWDGISYWDVLSVPGSGPVYQPTMEDQPNIELYDVEVDSSGDGFVVGGVGTNCGRAYEISSWTTVTWEQLGVNNPSPVPPPASCPANLTTAGSTLYAMGLVGDGRGLGVGYARNSWRSSTSSTLWESTYQELPSGDPVKPPMYGGTAVNTDYFAVGHFGAIMHSSNATSTTPTWSSLHDTETARPKALEFISASTGWFTGQNGRVDKTTDGGATFTEVYTPGAVLSRSIDFTDANNGVVVGREVGTTDVPFVAYTHAGGDSGEWTEVTDSGDFPDLSAYASMKLDLHEVVMVDADDVWAVGDHGLVLVSDDGGETWADGDGSDDIGTVDLRGAAFLSANAGAVVGASGGAWLTIGSGWVQIPVKKAGGATFTGTLHDVAVRSPDTVIAVGDEGRIFVYVPTAGTVGEFQQVYQASSQSALLTVELRAGDIDVFAAGDEGVFVWYDGSWNEPNSLTSYEITDLALIGDDGALISHAYQLHLFEEVP